MIAKSMSRKSSLKLFIFAQAESSLGKTVNSEKRISDGL